jgi:hypothetical protein
MVNKLLHFPLWQHRYESALCETNDTALFQKLEVAESAMLAWEHSHRSQKMPL